MVVISGDVTGSDSEQTYIWSYATEKTVVASSVTLWLHLLDSHRTVTWN